jgi:hypothetical protein
MDNKVLDAAAAAVAVAAVAPAPDEKVVGWSFFDILQSEIMKRYAQELMKPIGKQIYEYTYPYVWMICIYSIFLFVLILANFLLLVKIYWKFCYNKSAAASACGKILVDDILL